MKMLMFSTVSEFFRQRAGMFFVLMGLLFGFLSGAEHRAFALFFLTGSHGMLYLFAIWLCYTLLSLQFVVSLWKQPAYAFIYDARIWAIHKRAYRFVLLALGFLQPILYYGIYLVSISVQADLTSRLWPVPLFYLFLASIILFGAEWRIRHPQLFVAKESRSWLKWPFPRINTWTYWSLEWLFREKGVTLLAGKLGAGLVATGTILYYSTDAYDLRMPAVGLSLAFLLNIGISYELYRWESDVWLWGRSLPVPGLRRLGRIIWLHAIIILPETLVVVRNGVLTFYEVLQLFGLGLAALVFVHVFFYERSRLLEDSIQTVLFGFVGLTLLILYKIPLLLISACIFIFVFYMFPKWYRV
jgi:hypothetical protein